MTEHEPSPSADEPHEVPERVAGPADLFDALGKLEYANPDVLLPALARYDELAPLLHAIVTMSAEGAALDEAQSWRVFWAVHLIGAARDQSAFPMLLVLLRRSADELDELLGDSLTDTVCRVLVGTFNGDLDALQAFILDTAVSDLARDAAFDALVYLAAEGVVVELAMREFLRAFHANRAVPVGDYGWVSWSNAIAMLGYEDFRPEVHQVFAAEWINFMYLDVDDWEADLAAALANRGDDRWLQRKLGPIEDICATLAWVQPLEEPVTPWRPKPSPAPMRAPWAPMPAPEPVRDPLRGIGRNDPCPCGSGKKYKKCCLGA